MAIVKFAGFIIAVLCVVFGAHMLYYYSIMRFWAITDPAARRLFLWPTIFLALSFFPSAVLLRFHYHFLTALFYYFSCLWLGLFLYLLMSIPFLWAVFGMGKGIGSTPNMRIVSIGFFLLAAFLSAYGLWRAQNPAIREIEVNISALPDHWRGRTLVQLSDVHLGTIHGRGFMQKVANRVNRLKPDMILITGDLFDGMGGKLSSFIEPIKRLEARRGVYFVTGNHEGYLGLADPLSILKKTHVRILDNEILEVDGLQILGISFPEHDREKGLPGLLSKGRALDPAKPSILLYHTPTNIAESNRDRGIQQTRTYWTPDTGFSLAKKMGVDLQLSGHTHRGQLFPFQFLTGLIYRGFDHGLHKRGRFHLYVSSGVGTWGPPVRVGVPPEIVAIKLR